MYLATGSGSFYQLHNRSVAVRQFSHLNRRLVKQIELTENPICLILLNNPDNKPYTLLRTKGYPQARIVPTLSDKQKLTIEMKHGNPFYSGQRDFHLTYSPSPACCRVACLSVQVF